MPAPHQPEPRPRFAPVEPQQQERLVVLQLHVVARLVRLDELVLEERRFLLAAGHERLEIDHLVLEARHEGPLIAAARLEVAAHTAAQRARLAHVEHHALLAVEHVDPGLGGQRVELALNEVVDAHGRGARGDAWSRCERRRTWRGTGGTQEAGTSGRTTCWSVTTACRGTSWGWAGASPTSWKS